MYCTTLLEQFKEVSHTETHCLSVDVVFVLLECEPIMILVQDSTSMKCRDHNLWSYGLFQF